MLLSPYMLIETEFLISNIYSPISDGSSDTQQDMRALSNLAQQWDNWPGKSAVSPNHKNQQKFLKYRLKLPPEYDHEVRFDALEVDINTDEATTITPITKTSTKQDQDIKENTGTLLIY